MAATAAKGARAQDRTVRVGYQKYGTLILLKEKGFLEEALRPKGVSVQWAQFPAGPPLLQALVGGSLDFGGTGDLPPVFAQASTPDGLIYAGHESPADSSEAIIVPGSSPIRSVGDLKGKRVVVARGSDAHWLLVSALQQHGLSLHDVKISYLLPAAARPAFEAGNVDAWAIWDPYLSGAGDQVRAIATGKDIGGETEFYLARRGFFTENRDLLRIVIDTVAKGDEWANANKPEVAAILARTTGLDLPVVQRSVAKLDFGFHPMTPDIVAAQQHIADTFHAAGLLSNAPDVSQAAPQI